jgi:hypothetical protein
MKAGALRSGVAYDALLVNISVATITLQGTNTLAYFAAASASKLTRFITLIQTFLQGFVQGPRPQRQGLQVWPD